MHTQFVICERLGYIGPETAQKMASQVERVGQLLNGTLRYLKRAADREPRTATPRSPSPE